MKPPTIRRSQRLHSGLRPEAGVTMVLVALSMVAIVAMAALSIDVVTLYLSRMEAQRSADAGALAAARVIAVSGLTGDPADRTNHWAAICGGSASIATKAADAAATQSAVSGVPPTVDVRYSSGTAAPNPDCSTGGLKPAFGVNPLITVQVSRTNVPTFFSRMWGNRGNNVSATAVAEAFNSSNSGNVGNGPLGTITPVRPRCVKPWIVPNWDPLSPNTSCTTHCDPFVNPATGQVVNPGISLNGGNSTGVIGETFWLSPICQHTGSKCNFRVTPIQNNFTGNPVYIHGPPSLLFFPGEAPSTASTAVPGCAAGGSLYEKAVAGCDQSTQYQCGVQHMNTVDLNDNPDPDTGRGVQCLIHETDPNDSAASGQDTLNPFAAPSAYPFQILAGTSNPLVLAGTLPGGNSVSGSNSIVTVPIYDDANAIATSGTSTVTIVGFLQVFINRTDTWGSMNVTVLNVTGCSNGGGQPVGRPVTGSSPVPVRLITPQ